MGAWAVTSRMDAMFSGNWKYACWNGGTAFEPVRNRCTVFGCSKVCEFVLRCFDLVNVDETTHIFIQVCLDKQDHYYPAGFYVCRIENPEQGLNRGHEQLYSWDSQ